ncbi:MAG: helix-turn-helix domain-containing protein [Cyanobacteriota bacterium]|nr:helix-turn-helix domain-containing protein [Cyanobacteriota bacterium]
MPDFTLTTREVADRLRTSDSTLRRLRREGVLKPGVHYRGQGLGTLRPVLLWDAVATDAALAQRSRRALR